MLRFFSKLLFVLFFFRTGIQKLYNPVNYSKLFIDRYERFQNLAKAHNFEFLSSLISLESIKLQVNQINKLVGIGQIVFSIGIIFSVPYLSLLVSFFLTFTILLIHNPFYFEDHETFLKQLQNLIFEIALLGISLMFATNKKHFHEEDKVKKKKRKKNKRKENENDNELNNSQKKKKNENNQFSRSGKGNEEQIKKKKK